VNKEATRTQAVHRFREGKSLAVLTGAGISQESGIPTFRGPGGLWKNYRAEDLASPEAFARDPRLVWEWYQMRRGICEEARPNAAHETVQAMEEGYDRFLLITQNVDGLHGRAGSRKMEEIHGNIHRARCLDRGHVFDLQPGSREYPVLCAECGEPARPHIVWFGESYDPDVLARVQAFISSADLVLVVGTSGMVSMPTYLCAEARRAGAFILEANLDDTEITPLAHATLRGKAGEVLPSFWNEVRE